MREMLRPARGAGRQLVVAALLASVMLAFGPATHAVAQNPPGAGEQTLTLVGKRGIFTLPGVPAVGAAFLAGGGLYDSTGNTKIGDAYSSCTIVQLSAAVPPAITAQCSTVFALADGQLYLSSLRTYVGGNFTKSTFAVVGGTGKYRTARGDGTGELSDPTAHTYTFTLKLTM